MPKLEVGARSVPDPRGAGRLTVLPCQPPFFKLLADNSPLFIGMCDMNYQPFYLNEAGRRLVGLDEPRRFAETPERDYFFPEDQDFILNELFPRVFKEGRAETEIRFRHFGTGAAIWITYDVFFLSDESGKAVGHATVSRDISRRKRVEEAHCERNRQLNMLARASQLLSGGSEAAMLTTILDELARIVEMEFWFHYRVADGTVRWLESRGLFHQSPQGRVIRSFGVMIDITGRKQAEQALRESKESFKAIVASAMDAIVAIDGEQKIILFNDAAETMFGCKAREAIGAFIDRFIPARFRSEHHEHIRRFGESGATTRATGQLGLIRGVRANGEEFPIEASISKLALDDRRIYTVILRDITERIRAETALKEAERRKDEFIARLAHELRNPLAPIGNGVTIMRRNCADEQSKRLLDMMQRQTDHLVQLVDDLLEIPRISRGKIDLCEPSVAVAGILRHAVETCQPLLDKKGHRIRIDVPDDPLRVFGDKVRLEQIVANLINNAAKYTPPGGAIDVSSAHEGDEAVLRVRDNGVGLAAESLPRVFDLFRQLGEQSNNSERGLGIGLALVRKLVELHGGPVEALSEGLGQGSEFVVRLPKCKAPAAVSRENDTAADVKDADDGESLRGLVIDDDRDVAESFGLLLESFKTIVRVAYDGLSGIAAIEDFNPELIFCDISMPGVDGYESERRICEGARRRPFTLVALTGWGQEEDRRRAQAAGFDMHLTKPASVDAIETLLREARAATNELIRE